MVPRRLAGSRADARLAGEIRGDRPELDHHAAVDALAVGRADKRCTRQAGHDALDLVEEIPDFGERAGDDEGSADFEIRLAAGEAEVS